MLFKQYAEGQGATLRELKGESYDELRAQLLLGERLFGAAEGVREELSFELQLMLALLGIVAVPADAVAAMPLSDEHRYLTFQRMVQAKKPRQVLYYAVSGFNADQPSFRPGPTNLV